MSVKFVPLSVLKVSWIVCQTNALVTLLFFKNTEPMLRMTSCLTLCDARRKASHARASNCRQQIQFSFCYSVKAATGTIAAKLRVK